VGDTLLLDPAFEADLGAAGIGAAEGLFALGGDPALHRFGEFVELPIDGEARRFYLKRYHYAGWSAARGLLGRGTLWGVPPEINEFRALTWLRAHDLPAVRPVAAAARTRGGRLVAHALLTEAVPRARDLAARLRSADDPLRASHRLRREVARSIGDALGRMHRLGFVHRDCHARNILVRVADDGPRIWFLDCRRGGIGGRKGPVFDLATLDLDLRGRLSRGERRHALEAYLAGRDEAKALVRRIADVQAALPPPRR